MTNERILGVLNELEYRQRFLVWYLPESSWERYGGRLYFQNFYLSDAEERAVVADEPYIGTVDRAFKGLDPVILARPSARFSTRCMKCLWHIEPLTPPRSS